MVKKDAAKKERPSINFARPLRKNQGEASVNDKPHRH